MEMEVVRIFNNELSSLYEVKPPISKAKMTQITKSAIKGIKFYKHIVQSVEKFIQKCRPEYKVPGLYVVDSIVRQSRHQFGADKDVFGPRFVKNINNTFQHLFKCSQEDRPKIIRVLNLWQKNAVFPIDVIQPLMDMGHPNSSSDWPSEPQAEMKESPLKAAKEERQHKSGDNWKGWMNDEAAPETHTYAEMSTKNLEKFMKTEMTNAIEEEASRFRNQAQFAKTEENTVKFNKKLLDFDYGDEDEEEMPKNEDTLQSTPNALALSISQNLLSNPDLLRQLQQLSSIQQQQGGVEEEHNKPEVPPPISPQPSLPTYEAPHIPLPHSDTDKDDRILPPSQDLDERSLATIAASHRPLPANITCEAEGDRDERIIPEPPRDLDERSLSAILAPIQCAILPPLPFNDGMIPYQNNNGSNSQVYQQPPLPLMDPTFPQSSDPLIKGGDEDERIMYSMPGEPPLPPQDFDERPLIMPGEERDRPRKERSRSRSGSRSRGSRRHRSRSPRRTSRSRKSSRSEGRERIQEKERERERERERRKKGLPPTKKGCASVCSTTLWLGHVPKSCTENDISAVFGEFGKVLSIDMIPPRGCAFVVMDKRQDANKAVLKLKNLKLQSSLVKMAWAPGKGVKSKEYKEYWDVNAGVSYVPYEKIPEGAEGLDLLEEGGFIDEESLPENLKELRSEVKPPAGTNKTKMDFSTVPVPPPIVPPPSIIPPTTVNLPGMVLPHLMQPQFGLPLPGLLPHQAMVMQVPMGIPPPNPMMMVQQQSQGLIGMPPMMPRAVPPVPNALQNFKGADVAANSPAGDATPTEEDSKQDPSPAHNSLSSTVSSTQQTNSIPHFNPMMGLQNPPMLPPPVSSAGGPIPYPPPGVGFNFPPPGMRPPQFPWMQQKPAVAAFTEADSKFTSNKSDQAAVTTKQDGEEKKSEDMDISGNRSSSPTHHDMVISTDDESSMDRDYPRNEPQYMGPTEFPPRLPFHHPRGGPMRFPRGSPLPPPPLRMGRHMEQHMEMGGPRMPPRRDNIPPPEGRDWYPRDYDTPPFARSNRFERPRDSWRESESKPQMLDNEGRDSFNEKRNSRDDNRSSNEESHKLKNDTDESKNNSKRKTDKKPSKSLMDDMFKLRFYQRDKNPGYASHLSKKLETKKKETVKPKPQEPNSTVKTPEEKVTPPSGGKESRKRSRWGRTLSEEREIQDQRRFEIEIKFQSYEQSSKALQEPSESQCNNNNNSVSEEPKLETSEPKLETSNVKDCDNPSETTTTNIEMETVETSKSEPSDSTTKIDNVNNQTSAGDIDSENTSNIHNVDETTTTTTTVVSTES